MTLRHPEWKTLQSESTIIIDRKDRGKDTFDANLLVEFPEKTCLRGSRAPIGTLFEVISVGNRMSVYFNRDGLLFSGYQEDLDPKAGIIRMAGPRELLRALLAERDLAERMRGAAKWQVRERPNHWLLWLETAPNRWQIWVVRKSDFLVEETLIGGPGDNAAVRIHYWRYTLIEGEPLPSYLEIILADPAVQVLIDVDKYRINPPLKPAVFQARKVSADHLQPLRLLQLEESE